VNPVADLAGTTDLVCGLFDSLHVPYALGGAIAQNFWGIVRATQDADFLVSLPRVRFPELKDGLDRSGFRFREGDGSFTPISVERIVEEESGGHVLAVYRGLVKVEIFFPILPLQHAILRRAVPLKLGNHTVPVTTAEDMILLKLAFHREKDLLDVRGMLASRKGKLDLVYLREWAAKMFSQEIRDELEAWIRAFAV
jgi:hypothetical protein